MKNKVATVMVNLEGSLEDIKKRLDKDARWGISKAEKENLRIVSSKKSKDWNDFYKIYEKTLILGGNNPKPLNFLKRTSDILLLCKKEFKLIGGAALKMNGPLGVPRLRFNASLKEFQKMQPNNLLYWHCIKEVQKEGYKKFDLGGWQIKAREHLKGVNKFKERWGEVFFYEENLPLFKWIGKKLIRNFRIFYWSNKKFKGRR